MTIELLFSFLTLSLLEIVLGIDNLIFIALVVAKLPPGFREKARLLGLGMALGMRILMLLGASYIMQLTEPVFFVKTIGVDSDFGFSWKDILLILGGLFLIVKSTLEMHSDIAGHEVQREVKAKEKFFAAVVQISLIDLVFSFDSIITAVGLTTNIPVIIAAMTVAMAVMLMASKHVSRFLEQYPTLKILALAFILMIGVMLLADGFHQHFPREYIYFAFAFSIFTETLNIVANKKREKRRK